MEKPIDINQCDSEPVRFINALQSFGAMLIIDESSVIKIHSENFFHFVNIPERALLGLKYTADLFNHDKFEITKTYKDNFTFIHIEEKPINESETLNLLLDKLQTSENLEHLLHNSAETIAELTGFDRVMIYKFHEDFHGEVVAEKVKPGVESFDGLHYPATDIPTPARAIFLENWVRIIPDVHYNPVALKSALSEVIDLGQSILRAVSPIHITYLKNMNVGATLTISLVIDNKLWGLIACHHLTKATISKDLRNKCETIGRFISSLITSVSLKERTYHAEKIRKVHIQLINRIKDSNDMAKDLVTHTPTLLDLISAQGASAALYMDGYWIGVGVTPSNQELNDLVEWISQENKDTPVWQTNNLSKIFPKAISYRDIASGVLAASVPKTAKNYILWFRPEISKTVVWAGNPDKEMNMVNGRLTPRASFLEWKESVHGESVPWKEWEIDAALELRNAIMAIDLKKQFEKEQKSRQEAERAKQTREELMEVVSHDLKNPLSSIQMNTHLLKKFLPTTEEKSLALIERISRSSMTMNNLINDILSMATIESGQMDLEKTRGCVTKVIKDSIDMLSPMAADKGITLIDNAKGPCKAEYDYERLMQVLSNLIGNAIKFTPANGSITVDIAACGPDFVKISVTDTGPGIPKENLTNVFDRYWQAHQTKRLGTGLGLSIAKGIIQTHGGEIWVESTLGKGASFQFTLPIVVS